MEEESSNKYLWLLAIPFILIGTCNYYLNTYQEDAILNGYQQNDYFIFSGFGGVQKDLPFKIKEISSTDVIFYVPQYEIKNFDMYESLDYFYKVEEEGEMYTDITFSVPKSEMDKLKNGTKTILAGDYVLTLKGFFGALRESDFERKLRDVSSTLKKLENR